MDGEKVLFFDPQKCIGCRLCEIFCSLEHFGVVNPTKTNIRIFRDHEKQIDIAQYCHQCEDVPCVDACMFAAIERDEKTGAIIIESENCTACEACLNECPYGAPSLLPDYAIVCDLCDGKPSCAENCPEKAIKYIPREEAIVLEKELKLEHDFKIISTMEENQNA